MHNGRENSALFFGGFSSLCKNREGEHKNSIYFSPKVYCTYRDLPTLQRYLGSFSILPKNLLFSLRNSKCKRHFCGLSTPLTTTVIQKAIKVRNCQLICCESKSGTFLINLKQKMSVYNSSVFGLTFKVNSHK